MNVKLLLLGGPCVGKSSFLNKYIYNIFSEKYTPTLNIHYGEKSIVQDKQDIHIEMWDISGKELCDCYNRIYYFGTNVALIFIDLSNKKSFDDALVWKKNLEQCMADVKSILIFNKSDLPKEKWVMNKDELKMFSKQNGFDSYYIISVKRNNNFDDLIDYIVFLNKKIRQQKMDLSLLERNKIKQQNWRILF